MLRMDLQLDEAHLERVRAALAAKARRATQEMGETGYGEMQVAESAVSNLAPVATGQTRERIHTIPLRRVADGVRCGLAVGRTENGQEVEMEAGRRPSVHSSESEHDRRHRCSTGNDGGWGDGDEQTNVRDDVYGGRLDANPNATFAFFWRGVTSRMGFVIDGSAARTFFKGRRNVYPKSFDVMQSLLVQRLRSAAVRIFKSVALLILLCSNATWAQAPLAQWDKSTWFECFKRNSARVVTNCTADTLVPNVWLTSNEFYIDDREGSPQFFTLFCDLDGFGASQGNPSLRFAALSGRWKGGTDYLDWSNQDTLEFVPAGNAVTGLVKFTAKIPVPGGDVLRILVYNSGDTCLVDVDSSGVWGKH